MSLETLKQISTDRIKAKADKIIDYMVKNHRTSTTEMTSSCAPAFGWSVEEYQDMPRVADELRSRGLHVTSKVNHGVTDWFISI